MEKGTFTKKNVIDAMNKFLVLSLFTDEGPRKDEFSELGQQMTGSVTVPQYVLVDPHDYKVLASFDYNQAREDDFAERVEKAHRRYQSRARSRGVGTVAAKGQ